MAKRIAPKIVGATAAFVTVASLLIVTSAQGHSEPPPRRTATIAGNTYISVAGPPELSRRLHHRSHLQPERMTVTLAREGEAVASTTSLSGGAFSFAVPPGRYVVSAQVGPPHFVPGGSCGNTTTVSVVGRQIARVRIICGFG
jgi:hypothetical protein